MLAKKVETRPIVKNPESQKKNWNTEILGFTQEMKDKEILGSLEKRVREREREHPSLITPRRKTKKPIFGTPKSIK